MVTGTLPFRGDTSALIFNAILHRAPVAPIRLNPDMPQKLEHIINRALEKDRELRYQGAKEMRSELMRLKRDRESGRSSATSTSLGTAELSSAARAGSLEIAAAVLKTGRPKSIGGKAGQSAALALSSRW